MIGREREIQMLERAAASPKSEFVNLCEMKWCDGPYEIDADEAERLRNRRAAFVRETETRKAVHLTLVTPYGLKQNRHSGLFQSVVTLDDLFRDMQLQQAVG